MKCLDDFSLTDQVVIVTGAGRGIGQQIALDAARSGATVVGCSRTRSELDQLEFDIAEAGGTCATIVVDLKVASDIAAVFEFAEAQFGRFDSVVNNAGDNRMKDAVDYDEAEIDHLLAMNLKTVYISSIYAAKRMIAAGVKGSVLNITSQAGVVAAPGRAPYGAAKAGANHLSRTLAAEWAPHGIRVNALAPTVTATPLAKVALAQRPALAAEVSRKIALKGRAATVEEISRPAIFLLSPAAGLITGQTLTVDGGWTL